MMILLALSVAHGASYYFLDSGTRSIGRGGAFIAGADDLSAQYYNPAALTHITRPTLNFNFWGLNQYVAFTRMDVDDAENGSCLDGCETVKNESGPMLEPQLGFATPLGKLIPALEGSTFAIGMYVPTSPMMAFDPDGAQRYALVDSLVWQIYAGPSVALRTPKIPWLTVGAGLQYTFLRADESLTVSAIIDTDGSDGPNAPLYKDTQDGDVQLTVRSWDKFQLSWNAGLLIQPVKWLEIGASVQPAIQYNAPGTLSVEFNKDHLFNDFIESPTATDPEINLAVKVPWILRGGVQVRPVQALRVEAAFTWTDWSETTALDITEVNLLLKTKDSVLNLEDIEITDDVAIPTGFVDAWSVRLGGDYALKPWARVSLGGYYESSAVEPARQGVSVVDSPKWGLGAGASFDVKQRLTLDLSFGQQFLADRTITDSELRQITLQTDPFNTEDTVVDEGLVVGNGQFTSRLTFLAVGASVYFGPAPEPAP